MMSKGYLGCVDMHMQALTLFTVIVVIAGLLLLYRVQLMLRALKDHGVILGRGEAGGCSPRIADPSVPGLPVAPVTAARPLHMSSKTGFACT